MHCCTVYFHFFPSMPLRNTLKVWSRSSLNPCPDEPPPDPSQGTEKTPPTWEKDGATMRHQNYTSSPMATTSRDGLLRFSMILLATKQAYRQPYKQIASDTEIGRAGRLFLSTKQKKRHQTKHLKLKHCLPLPPALRVTPNKIPRLPTKPTIGVSPSNPSIKSNAVATPVSGLGGWMNDDIIIPTHRQRNFRPRKLSTICSELRRRTVTDPYLDIRQGGMPWRYDIETKPFASETSLSFYEVGRSCKKLFIQPEQKYCKAQWKSAGTIWKTAWEDNLDTLDCDCRLHLLEISAKDRLKQGIWHFRSQEFAVWWMVPTHSMRHAGFTQPLQMVLPGGVDKSSRKTKFNRR